MRECAPTLTRSAKASGCAIVLVGHVTKEGALAGPRVLEHMVDTVLYFGGDTHSPSAWCAPSRTALAQSTRLRFAMTDKGLRVFPTPAPFSEPARRPVPGSCVLVTWRAAARCWWRSRPWSTAAAPAPRPRVGLERDRLAMLLAVLHRHAGGLDQDVFVNAVGGVRISEPAADLAVMLAITSCCAASPCPAGLLRLWRWVIWRGSTSLPARAGALKEAAKLGFTRPDPKGQRARSPSTA